jgi:rhodanese-related sulfurtransferase
MSKRTHTHRRSSKRAQPKFRIPWWAATIAGVLVVAAIVVVAVLSKPSPAGPSQASDSVQTSNLPADISVDQAYQQYEQGAFFLDVRTVDEWNSFHIPNSTLIPLEQLSARLNEVPRDRQVIVVCRTGSRSRSGRDLLLGAGFTQVSSVTGGVTAWSQAGYPIDGTRP